MMWTLLLYLLVSTVTFFAIRYKQMGGWKYDTFIKVLAAIVWPYFIYWQFKKPQERKIRRWQ